MNRTEYEKAIAEEMRKIIKRKMIAYYKTVCERK